MSDVDRMITSYQDAKPKLSEREKARLEYQIWSTAKKAGQKTANRVLWVARTLGVSTHDVRGRMTLYTSAGDAADTLWARVESPVEAMPVHTAADFLTKAKHKRCVRVSPSSTRSKDC